jgi:hypothetical protein
MIGDVSEKIYLPSSGESNFFAVSSCNPLKRQAKGTRAGEERIAPKIVQLNRVITVSNSSFSPAPDQ